MGSRIFLLILCANVCLSARGGETGFAAKPLDLLDRPEAQARVVARLVKRQPLEILARDGSWAKTQSGNTIGWVRLTDLRRDAMTKRSPATANRRNVGRSDTGIRGFSEEELLVGAPNLAEGDKLRRLGVAASDVASFARAANLRPRAQDYILMNEYMPEEGLPEGFFDE